MISYSPSVVLAWRIAARETGHARFQYIEREQIFVGLLKAKDFLEPQILEKLEIDIADIDEVQDELDPLDELLARLNVDRTELRRMVRKFVGKGDYKHREMVVHRSEDCKRCFGRAEEIARMGHSLSLTFAPTSGLIRKSGLPHYRGILKAWGGYRRA